MKIIELKKDFNVLGSIKIRHPLSTAHDYCDQGMLHLISSRFSGTTSQKKKRKKSNESHFYTRIGHQSPDLTLSLTLTPHQYEILVKNECTSGKMQTLYELNKMMPQWMHDESKLKVVQLKIYLFFVCLFVCFGQTVYWVYRLYTDDKIHSDLFTQQ